ncbi:choice-of-anchor L domain-containing protein [Krasilnikoviella flava]|uniref:Fibronectin type-III domain-containing protein n=1 Tax=Krasilnikoviella flava TaxID=526729 RepID=A0A1T5LIM8_9MICO|nr:choice-of-anchor L domain-containing protein [Krasilnikoviella flava]SKC75840.1 hypothetical protein SAMN04324258_3496 [Krasilnikoviella flava]
MRHLLRYGIAALTSAALVAGAAVGAHAAPPGTGTIRVTFSTPDDVPGQLNLTSKEQQYVASKGVEGTGSVVEWDAPSGRYSVEVDPVMAGKLRYVGIAEKLRNIQVKPGATTDVTVTYFRSQGVQEVHQVGAEPDRVTLAWDAPPHTSVQVRRTLGDEPATSPSEGVRVETDGDGLVDTGLEPGTQYTYSLWARPGDSAHGVANRAGPVALTVGTPDPERPETASYTVRQMTMLATADDVVSAQQTGDGVRVVLAEGVDAPAPGAAVVLPATDSLPGGFVGVVDDVSLDGRTLALAAGGVGDGLDYLDMTVPDLGAVPLQEIPPPDDPTATAPEPLATDRARAGAPAAEPGTQAIGECNKLGAELGSIGFDPGFEMDGHIDVTVDKYNVLGVDVPTGLGIDTEVAVTLSGALSATAKAAYECEITLPSLMKTFTAGPVPLALLIKPAVKIGVSGELKISNVGAATTIGFAADGYVGLEGDNHFDTDLIAETEPLVPKAEGGAATIQADVAGDLVFGPGAGTTDAGVIAGIGGTIAPLSAKAMISFPGGDPCVELGLGGKIAMILTARAWLGVFEAKAETELLSKVFQYAGSPWHFPSGCNEAPDPTGDLLGDGVTMVDDEVVGDAGQWGHVGGYVPDTTAWVLSTGSVEDAKGDPGNLASTDLDGPGNDALSALAGVDTRDAAAYRVRLVPTGDTLRVRYVFASEEYPEFVGSRFNDAMGVFVDGQNCATVPGTTSPVSVATVNADTNAQYFVDNAAGAPGYDTAFDGLTVPLECAVPVDPGVAVDVVIAVGDVGDRLWDSAVAIPDDGIWSD